MVSVRGAIARKGLTVRPQHGSGRDRVQAESRRPRPCVYPPRRTNGGGTGARPAALDTVSERPTDAMPLHRPAPPPPRRLLTCAATGSALLLAGLLAACGDGAGGEPETPETDAAVGAGGQTGTPGDLPWGPSGGQTGTTGGLPWGNTGGGGGPVWDAGTGGGSGGGGGGPVGGEAPPPGDEAVETLLSTTVELNRGVSGDIRFEVPDDAVGLAIYGVGNPAGMFVVEHLEDPTGEAIVTDNPPGGIGFQDQFLSPWPGQFRSPNRAAPSEAMATLLVPNNPELALRPGEWSLRIAGANASTGRPATGDVDVILRVKRAPRAPEGGELRLNLYFTGARGWTADSAPTDPDFQAALFRMGEFYAGIGIQVKAVSYHDIDSSFRVIDSFQGEADNELGRLFENGTTEDGVNLFFVDRFGGQFGGNIGGIAGAIPGPSGPGLGGTSRSGVCVATSIDPDPRSIGHVMGHETGHYLGLFHTSELAVQGVHDPIPDTPEGQAGGTNLMFPTVTSAPAHLTEQQGQILRGNPTILPEGGQP
jgi:hypothetical protein